MYTKDIYLSLGPEVKDAHLPFTGLVLHFFYTISVLTVIFLLLFSIPLFSFLPSICFHSFLGYKQVLPSIYFFPLRLNAISFWQQVSPD